MKKYVVVGGAGFIGSHIVSRLVRGGNEVHVIDNLTSGRKENVDEKAVLYEVDMRDLESLLPIMEGADVVFHLAAKPSVPYSIKHPVETNEINIGGTLNVLYAAHKAGVRRVVYSASSSAYGNQETMPVVETMVPNPISPYGVQKHVGELYCRVFSETYGLQTVALRYFNVYGERQNPNGDYAAVIPKFIELNSKGEKLTITGDGEQTRDFTHVSDVVEANILASESTQVGNGEVVNVGAGDGCSINELAEIIGGEIEYVEARLEPKDSRADNARARALLGWEPKVSLQEGVSELQEKWGE